MINVITNIGNVLVIHLTIIIVATFCLSTALTTEDAQQLMFMCIILFIYVGSD